MIELRDWLAGQVTKNDPRTTGITEAMAVLADQYAAARAASTETEDGSC